jgi:XTP/dITP diphosphohydrolase
MTVVSGNAPRVLLATRNTGKLAELRRMMAGRATVLGLEDVAAFSDEPETGATFEENALAKARWAARQTGEIALADDSGLAVDALGGMPGVLSARWSGRHGDDAANNRLLLAQLTDVPDPRRSAAFLCAVAVVVPEGLGTAQEQVVAARWPGRIIRETRGSHGFGYDPLFVPAESDADGTGRTSAELTPAEKDALSHRSRAVALMVPVLRDLLAGRSVHRSPEQSPG